MKSSKLFLIIGFLLAHLVAISQAPEPCGPEGEMEPFCEIACIICDIDGFSGKNDENEDGIAPPDFCTTTQHNIQWLAFIAGSENLTLRFDVGECDGGFFSGGLEVTVYEAIDCENPRMVMPCNGSVSENSSWTFSNTEPLTIGQYYFFVMDGDGGSVCNYTVNVLEGSTKVGELQQALPFTLPDFICETQPFTIFANPQVGATIYEWTIDGQVVGNADSLEVLMDQTGFYNICYSESNACDEAPPYCQNIEIKPLLYGEKELIICDGIPVEYKGELYTSAGQYPDVFISNETTCDSVISINVIEAEGFNASYNYNICEGDTLFLNDEGFCQEGEYSQNLLTTQGCDSIIQIDLDLIVCTMQGDGFSEDLLCHGDGATGVAYFQISAGTPPFTYSYEKVLDPSINGTGTLTVVDFYTQIPNLPAGVYLITVNDNFGNSTIIMVEILEPTVLQNTLIASDYNGFNVSCFNGSDGELTANPSGGTPPYNYQWSGTSTVNQTAENLAAGLQSLTITDDAGCVYFETVDLSSPNEILSQILFTDPNCEGLETGMIQINNTSGGVGDYSYTLNGQDEGANTIFSNLIEGSYEVITTDANGCMDTVFQVMTNAEIPEVSLPDDFTITLGDSIQLIPLLNDITIGNVNWISSELLNCTDCLITAGMPLNTDTYLIQVTSADGCEREATISVFVEKDRTVYKPNIFSPSLSGDNAFFFITGGDQIKQIASFKVFDRWGNKMYEGLNLNHKDPNNGWDGSFNGQDANIGVYTWVAEVEFLDGFIDILAGDFTLIR